MVAQMRTKSALPKRTWRPRTGWGVPVAWLTLCIVWSSIWLAIKIGLRDLPPISYAGIRFLVAIIVLFAVSAWRVGLLPQREEITWPGITNQAITKAQRKLLMFVDSAGC